MYFEEKKQHINNWLKIPTRRRKTWRRNRKKYISMSSKRRRKISEWVEKVRRDRRRAPLGACWKQPWNEHNYKCHAVYYGSFDWPAPSYACKYCQHLIHCVCPTKACMHCIRSFLRAGACKQYGLRLAWSSASWENCFVSGPAVYVLVQQSI